MDPVQPVEVADFMIAVIAGALVVMMGALYAVLFAFGRLWNKTILLALAYLSFLCLAASVLILARALNLEGSWQAITVALLIGYLAAPHAIWRLSVHTHGDKEHTATLSPSVGRTDR